MKYALELSETNRLLFLKLFNTARCRGHPAVFVRGFEGLPFGLIGNDLDIICQESHRDDWIELLCNIFEKVIVTNRFYYCWKTRVVSDGQLIEIDINYSMSWRGVDIVDHALVFNNLYYYKANTFIPAQNVRDVVTFYHSFCYGGFVNYKYAVIINRLVLGNDIFVKNNIRLFGFLGNAIIMFYLRRSRNMPRLIVNALRARALFVGYIKIRFID